MKRMRVIGTGSYLPERIVANHEVGGPLGVSSATIERLTGIRERRWAADGQASSDLAMEASRHALQAAGCSAGEVDAIILSTTSPDIAFPSTACFVQRGLGCRGVASFDVSASCSGFLYGLSMANAMILSGQAKTCLVVAAEVKSRFLDPTDAATAVLFGDGAGAVVVRGEDAGGPNPCGVLGIRLHSDGSKHDLIRVPAGGSRVPASSENVARGWTSAVTLNLAIGQGENVQAPLNVAYFYALLASPTGTVPPPHLVRVPNDVPTRQLHLSEQARADLREALIAVVESGTAARSRIEDLHIAGKTGTAQNPQGADHGWFVAFAPAEAPEVVVAAIIEFAEHGSSVAPLVTRIIARHLRGEAALDWGAPVFDVPRDSAPGPVPIVPQRDPDVGPGPR